MTPASPSPRRSGASRTAAAARATKPVLSYALRAHQRACLAIPLALIAVGFAGVSLAVGEALPPKLSAKQIVARNAAARGGLDAWRKVQTMVWVGHIESAHAPVPSVLFVLQQQRPNRTRFEIDALGQKTVRVFDGARGWKVRTAQNGARGEPQPYTEQELKFARGGQGIDGPLIDAAAKGNLVTLEGVDEIEGRKAYRLEVRLLSGERDRLWIDAKSFLERRCDRIADGPGPGGLPRHVVSLVYRDYKTFDGLKLPTVIETGTAAGSTPDRMVIERVVLNTPVDPRAFAVASPHPPNRVRFSTPGAESTPTPANDPGTAPPQ